MNNSNVGPTVTPEFDSRMRRLKMKYAKGGGVDKVHKVMHEFKHGQLHSGSKKGPKVTSRKQAIAIALSEKRAQLKRKYDDGGQVQTSPPTSSSPGSPGLSGAIKDAIAAAKDYFIDMPRREITQARLDRIDAETKARGGAIKRKYADGGQVSDFTKDPGFWGQLMEEIKILSQEQQPPGGALQASQQPQQGTTK